MKAQANKIVELFKKSKLEEVRASKLYKNYNVLCERECVIPMTQTAFGLYVSKTCGLCKRRSKQGIIYQNPTPDPTPNPSDQILHQIIHQILYQIIHQIANYIISNNYKTELKNIGENRYAVKDKRRYNTENAKAFR